jgi:sulfur relay (sulfurtransferase) complex TusBCD TusD component (DsrE family)
LIGKEASMKYLLVETKSPLDGGDWSFDVGTQLRELDHDVTIYLLQDGVFSARGSLKAGEELVQSAHKRGLTVLADAVSCRQRGVVGDRVAKTVGVAEMDQLVDLMMERSDKAIWH